MQKRLVALVIFTYLVLVWGSSFILTKKALLYFSSFSLGFFRIFFVSLLFLPLAIVFVKKYNLRQFFYASLVGFIGNLIPFVLYAFAQKGVDSYVAGVLNGTTTFFALILGVLFWRQRSNFIQWFGVLVGFFGVVGLLFAAGERDFTWNFFHGSLILLATFFYALNTHLVKNYLQDVSSVAIASMAFVLPGAVSFLVLLLHGELSMVWQSHMMPGLFYIMILAIFCTVVALVLYYYLIKITSPLFSASVTYVMPVVSILWGTADGEKITLLHVLMISLVLIGVLFANLDVLGLQKKQAPIMKKPQSDFEYLKSQ